MTNYPAIFRSLIVRVIIAAPFFYMGLTRGASAYSPFYILGGAIILASALAALAAEAFANTLESRGHFEDTPTPMYGIPQTRRASGLYEEAMEAYEAILQEFPEERRAYVEMIDICIVNLKDTEWARRIYQRGMETLTSEADKQALVRMYGAILTRLHEEMTEADRHKPVLKMPEHTGIIEEIPAKKVVRQLGGNRVQGSVKRVIGDQ